MLKVDIEGSEYMFLDKRIDDLSCRKVDQRAVEWHPYDHDTRYGVTRSPQRNVLVALCNERCGLEQVWLGRIPARGGRPIETNLRIGV